MQGLYWIQYKLSLRQIEKEQALLCKKITKKAAERFLLVYISATY